MAKLYLLGIFAVICAVFVSARNIYQNNDADIDAEIEALLKALEDPAKRTAAENITGDGNEDGVDGGLMVDDENAFVQFCETNCDGDEAVIDESCILCTLELLDGQADTEDGLADDERELVDEAAGKENLQQFSDR